MSQSDVSKYKSKKYFMKHGVQKKLTLESGLKGFLCSCNGREKDCVKESYNLLNEYADKLYPVAANPESEMREEEDCDISDSLAKEILELKGKNSNRKRFQLVESGAKNFLFIKTTLEDPVKLAATIVKDIHESGNQKTRFLLRLVPVEVTCRAGLKEILNTFSQLAEKHFESLEETFCIIFNHRNNNVVSRDEVIKAIADEVIKIRPNYKVDLKKAKLAIIVEIVKGIALLSIIPDYLKYKKYNLLSICNQQVFDSQSKN